MTNNIKIEYINQHHRFFQDVMNLGRKHSSTLGFMPEGGFIDHAQKKCIIIAHNNSELIGYLMFRMVIRSSRLSIVHLCIEENYRKQNIPIKLLDSLREKYQTSFSGISLSCRADYTNAKALWEKYGFVSKDKKRSRSHEENYLYKWWYDFNNPDLFNSTHDTTSKIKVLLDANIIVKLRDNQITQNASQDPRPLLADWLVEEVDYFYAPELLNEISRDKNQEREEITRQFLKNFETVRLNIEDCKKVANELKSIITGNSDNDESDRRQLATAITSKMPYLITFDTGILEKREILDEQYDIQIFTPHEFIIEIDQLRNKQDYAPSKLKGVTFHSIEKVSNTELDSYIDLFLVKSQSEKKTNFRDVVNKETLQIKSSKIKVIKQDNTAIAFFAYKYEKNSLIVSFIRLSDTNQKQTLFMQLISDFTNKAIRKNIFQITINEYYLSANQKAILERLGFENQSSIWIKFLYNKVLDSTQHSELDGTIDNAILERLKENNADEIKNILLSLEHKFFPLKFSDLDIPCYIIPIKPYWAGQLFDMNISGNDLFGANPDKLWNIENVYYRHTKPITEIAPARILWYASTDKKSSRSQSIIATSYLDEVMTGKPKLLFQRNKHYGIYEWKNIYDLCEKDIEKDIRALRFSNTEVFNKPVLLSKINEILILNGRKKNTFASPVKVNRNIFNHIYQIGNGKNK
jgi:predicted nucleic acid-binding protein